eukprot:1136908-Pelagomonas_calceolata.AAC.15
MQKLQEAREKAYGEVDPVTGKQLYRPEADPEVDRVTSGCAGQRWDAARSGLVKAVAKAMA